jgi:hypothetical protein
MSEVHILTLPQRTARLEITEEPTRVVMTYTVSKVGDFGDIAEIQRWLAPRFEKYDSDPRDTVFVTPNDGSVAVIYQDEDRARGIRVSGDLATIIFPPEGGA